MARKVGDKVTLANHPEVEGQILSIETCEDGFCFYEVEWSYDGDYEEFYRENGIDLSLDTDVDEDWFGEIN